MIAGLVMAIVQVPGAVANGVLAGVNPIYGLYSMIAGTTAAAIFTSSVIMNVDSTSATALATSEALASVSTEEQLGFLVVLGILVGLFMLILGLLKLGFLVRFVSNSVMTGFLSGLGVLTILGQVGDLTGFYSQAENKVLRALDTMVNFREIDSTTLIIGLLTIIIIIVVERTRFYRIRFNCIGRRYNRNPTFTAHTKITQSYLDPHNDYARLVDHHYRLGPSSWSQPERSQPGW